MKNGDPNARTDLPLPRPRTGKCVDCGERRRLQYRPRRGRLTLCEPCALRGLEYVYGEKHGR